MYPIIKIGSLSFPTYALMAYIGIIAGFVLGYFTVYKHEKLSKFTGWRIVVSFSIAGVSMYLGSTFFDALFHSIESGVIGIYGITWLGGVVVSFPVAVFLLHKLVPVAKGRAMFTFSLFIPSIILAHAFGRIGCFFAGCCYGMPTDSWIGVVFETTNGVKVLPTQLFEAAFEFIIVAIMLILRNKKFMRGHQLEFWLFFYSIFRFILEFFRGDNRGSTGLGFSPAQLLDVVCLVAAILIYLFYKQKVFKKMYRKCLVWQEEFRTQTDINDKKQVEKEKFEKIKELMDMKENGAISEEEYSKKMAKLVEINNK